MTSYLLFYVLGIVSRVLRFAWDIVKMPWSHRKFLLPNLPLATRSPSRFKCRSLSLVLDRAQTKRASTLAKEIQMLPFMTIMTPRDARYCSDNFDTNVKKAWYRIASLLYLLHRTPTLHLKLGSDVPV